MGEGGLAIPGTRSFLGVGYLWLHVSFRDRVSSGGLVGCLGGRVSGVGYPGGRVSGGSVSGGVGHRGDRISGGIGYPWGRVPRGGGIPYSHREWRLLQRLLGILLEYFLDELSIVVLMCNNFIFMLKSRI